MTLAELKALYQAAGNPIIIMDTKKKVYLGDFYRDTGEFACDSFRL
jgi:hypothetical protein